MSTRRHLPARAWFMIIVMAVLATSALFVFAWQTWEFVNWLLPNEQWLIKMLAVANFDIMSLVWILADLFLPLDHNAKVTAAIAGGIDFFFSTVATVLELTVVAALRFNQGVWPPFVYIAYAVIALTLVVNLVAFLLVIRIQWPYIVGEENLTTLPLAPKRQVSSGLSKPDTIIEPDDEEDEEEELLLPAPASGLENGAKKKTLPRKKH